MVTHHIHHAYLWDCGAEQIRAAVDGGSDQQAAVAASLDGKFLRRRPALFDQIFCGCDEIIENIDFLHLSAGFVPCFAILAATTQTGLCIDSAILKPHHTLGGEARCHGDIEASVAVKQGRILTVAFHAFLVGDEHWDLGSVG